MNEHDAVVSSSRPSDRAPLVSSPTCNFTWESHDPKESGLVVVRDDKSHLAAGLVPRGEQARLVKTVKVHLHPAGGGGSDRRFPLGAI